MHTIHNAHNTQKSMVTRKRLHDRISARFVRAMTVSFHFKFSIDYGKQETKNNKNIRYDLSPWN